MVVPAAATVPDVVAVVQVVPESLDCSIVYDVGVTSVGSVHDTVNWVL